VLAEHDSLVAVAQGEVERTVAAMALEIGADLTATLVGLDAAQVRHLAKARKEPAAGSEAGGTVALTARLARTGDRACYIERGGDR
jgi:hypothetical protein